MEDHLKRFASTSPSPGAEEELLEKAADVLSRQERIEARNLRWFRQCRAPLALAAALVLVVCANLALEHHICARHRELLDGPWESPAVTLDTRQIARVLEGGDGRALAALMELWQRSLPSVRRRPRIILPDEYLELPHNRFGRWESANGA